MSGDVVDDMVALAGGRFTKGSDAHYLEEAPARMVEVAPFRIDRSPVTNAHFAAFVKASGHVTVAERAPDPALYPGVAPERLKPGALVFTPPRPGRAPAHWGDWWRYIPGASWRAPEGRGSVWRGRMEHPVVCVAYADALAYAEWVGKALPSEAQWEFAARGGLERATFAWGEERRPHGRDMANTWVGEFPRAGLRGTSPVGAYPANGFGLHDMIGNVWEWTTDYFTAPGAASGCCGATREASFDRGLPGVRIPRRVVKGGSHLCHASYCDRYRPAARQPQMEDTATVHIGFRCVNPA